MGSRRFFVQHFIICLALLSGFGYKVFDGTVGLIWREDLSHMTSVIGLFVLFTCWFLGRQCWSVSRHSSALYGAFAAGICPMLGLIGTTEGLRLSASVISTGANALMPIVTSVSSMQVGVIGSVTVAILTLNLEFGILSDHHVAAGYRGSI